MALGYTGNRCSGGRRCAEKQLLLPIYARISQSAEALSNARTENSHSSPSLAARRRGLATASAAATASLETLESLQQQRASSVLPTRSSDK